MTEETGTIEIKLSRPIEAHGNTLDTLTLRPPLGRDIRECGMGFRIIDEGGTPTVEPQGASMARLIARLAGIPPSAVDKLAGTDFTAATMACIGFFFNAAPETPTS